MMLQPGGRIQISESEQAAFLTLFLDHLAEARRKKGDGIFASGLEAQGSIDQEAGEFREAVHAKDLTRMKDEALDVAVAGYWAAASAWKAGA